MINLPAFSSNDRVLVVAPHPDDEAIATGGVLQVARSQGAACRVLVVTDGDNNPWPQRWIEKRWRIGAGERARWGAQRRAEALAALQVLGLDPASAHCMGLPDLGLTDLLMRADVRLEAGIAAELAEFRPTSVFLPALDDRHPDHSALHVALRLAQPLQSGAAEAASLFAFGVHGQAPTENDLVLHLSEVQRELKRVAIMKHETQMRLSRRRFVAYAQLQERFRIVAGPGPQKLTPSIEACIDSDNCLRVQVDHQRWGGRPAGQALLVIARTETGSLRRRILLGDSGRADVIDTVADTCVGTASVTQSKACTKLTVPLAAGADGGWIKLARPTPGLLVLDRTGWHTITMC